VQILAPRIGPGLYHQARLRPCAAHASGPRSPRAAGGPSHRKRAIDTSTQAGHGRTSSKPPRETLRGALLATVDLLQRRRASEIPDGYIDGYVALNWLEWHGGGLRLTITGSNVCRQVTLSLSP
jgi:hypothetical protein